MVGRLKAEEIKYQYAGDMRCAGVNIYDGKCDGTCKPNTPASPGGMRTQKGKGINYAVDTGSVGYIYAIAMNAYRHISNQARVPLRDVGVELISISKHALQQQQ